MIKISQKVTQKNTLNRNEQRIGIVEIVDVEGSLEDIRNVSPEFGRLLVQHGVIGRDYELRRSEKLSAISPNWVEVYPLNKKH